MKKLLKKKYVIAFIILVLIILISIIICINYNKPISTDETISEIENAEDRIVEGNIETVEDAKEENAIETENTQEQVDKTKTQTNATANTETTNKQKNATKSTQSTSSSSKTGSSNTATTAKTQQKTNSSSSKKTSSSTTNTKNTQSQTQKSTTTENVYNASETQRMINDINTLAKQNEDLFDKNGNKLYKVQISKSATNGNYFSPYRTNQVEAVVANVGPCTFFVYAVDCKASGITPFTKYYITIGNY